MIILVNDANILIDLLKIDLLGSFFQLKYEFYVTDLVVAEVQEDDVTDLNHFIENGSLHKKNRESGSDPDFDPNEAIGNDSGSNQNRQRSY